MSNLQIITLQCVEGYKQKNPTNVGLEYSFASYSHSPSLHSVTPALSALQALP